ncbi:MAG: YceI family protein [Campylobacterota bacterium]|nr:YceI family protein [Campylobacterota bacterium]
MNVLKRVLVAVGFLGTMAYGAASCDLSQIGDVKVNWTAYKTPLKIGVSGDFKKVDYLPVAPVGKNFREILVGSKVTIDTASVNSGHEARDKTLTTSFFQKMTGSEIKAEIVDIKADKKRERGAPRLGLITIRMEMNGVTKQVPMRYHYNKGDMKAEGTIDLADFNALGALSSINKACFDLHEGKSWSDVAISFELQIKAILCHK